MIKRYTVLCALALCLLISFVAHAQEGGAPEAAASQEVEMADRMRADGKIYVVVGCVLAVLAGVIVYLIAIDKKVSRLERQIKG